MTQRFPVRDLRAGNQKHPQRMFDLIIDENGEPIIETKNEKVSHQITLKEAFEQAGKDIQLDSRLLSDRTRLRGTNCRSCYAAIAV